MTDFLIVAASSLAAALSTPAADPAAAVPLDAPTVGSKIHTCRRAGWCPGIES
jgi:hypothetical protein